MKKFLMVMCCVLMVCLVGCSASAPLHTLEFIKCEKVTVEERELVGVFFTYTNSSGETYLPADAINVQAFQNGVEIPVMVYTGTELNGAIQCDTAVQDGTSATVVWTFEPKDDSTVSIETTDGQSFECELGGTE